eukprot:403372439
MGASCSGSKATEVQDSVNKITLNANAKEHLKSLNPNAAIDKDKMQKLMKGGDGDGDGDVKDLDTQNNQALQQRKHQKLWEAIETNDIKAVEAILNKLGDSNSLEDADLHDASGQSMVHKAASAGHAEILMLLLERTGIKPDLVNAQLATPLHLACKNNRESVAKFLIGCGVDVNMQDEHGQAPLLICCIHGHYDMATLIVESSIAGHTPEPLEVDLKDHRGLTSLNCAAIKGDLKLTKLLLERGGANLEESSPKGCTPLLYSARGGYHEVVRYLMERGASPLKQDTSGGTVLHHAIEKGQLEVLQVLIEHGVDVYSAIEIADNAGRTPIFEAIDNNCTTELMRFLTKKRGKGGFGARVNVLNYSGQTPLFSAVREGNMENIQILVEEAGAKVDLTGGEVHKDTDDNGQGNQEEEEYDSLEEKYFMEAYKNATTPLHLACILGHDQIMLYLIDKGANPNLQSSIKGYTCLHLAVLSNKPEIIIELLTKTNASPQLPDYSGRTLIDMVEMFIPDYIEPINTLLENLNIERIKRAESEASVVATHYYNPDDDREIKGIADPNLINEYYQNQADDPDKLNADLDQQMQIQDSGKVNPSKKFMEMQDSEIEVEEGRPYERDIENIFGRKLALGLIAINWKFKETALKIIFKQAEKYLTKESDSGLSLPDFIRACTIGIDLTCKDKVIKVLTLSLQLLNLLITSPKLENSSAIESFKKTFIDRNAVLKLLQKSEEGNTRMTNKIHECLLDFSFHPKIGEAHVSSFILQRIQAHNKATQIKSQQEDNTSGSAEKKIQTLGEAALGSYKGLLAQLALLYKFVNSFGVSIKKRGPLNVKDIINAILPSLTHQSQDVRSASTKILLDIHRLSGAVKEEYLVSVNDKVKQAILEKISQVVVETNQNQNQQEEEDQSMLEQSQDEQDFNSTQKFGGNILEQIQEAQEKMIEKGQSKDWQERDLALKHMKEAFESGSKKTILQEEFLTNCTVLLKSCFEENNISLYLSAIEVSQVFFAKAIFTEVVIGSLQSLIKPLVLKTTDTNTRVRKKSVDLIFQIWNQQNLSQQNKDQLGSKANQDNSKRDHISSLIADVIADQSLQEKSIIGRLGLFIKRSSSIESGDDLNSKSYQLILGKNYEQLTEFACSWVSHKNTKVRQNALKLILEICRINSIDPRGQPFKQRIINFILGLRASLRDPLVKKINEVCTSEDNQGSYIDVNELELNMATKTRSVSMDHHNKRRQAQNDGNQKANNLPEIGFGQSGNTLPSVGGGGGIQPTIVLPHSEPLSDQQKEKHAHLIQLFGLEIITCFNSQFWSARQASIDKVSEQLHNLDPNRRDAMTAEINRKNFPIEENFMVFLDFIEEGAKDPVLKNFIAILELMQKALPVFFRYLQPAQIKKDLAPLVSNIIKKTSDLKAKIREASQNFCLYLSHQSPIGPESMVNSVLTELEAVLDQNTGNVATNLGNSHMISSCLKLLNQFQQETKILEKKTTNQVLFNKFISVINASLKHQNPQVRKEGEALFKTLYAEFAEKLDNLLVNQKSQVTQKLLLEAKQETGNAVKQQQDDYNLQRAQTQIRTDFINQSSLTTILSGVQDELQNLKLPNPKKRLKAIIEIKKAIQKQVVNVSQKTARDLFEPLSLLMRQLLQDDSPEIYLETLNMLKFVVGSLAPHLSTLDLHLMLGSFISIIVNNTVSSNLRTQMASDKVIIFFAKHNNIGPFVVAKDITKNIEKVVKAVQAQFKKEDQLALLQDKKPTMLRFLSILSLLLQHFSIVLCYQADFYDKCIELIADTMNLATDDQSIKNLCVQLIVSLQAIDYKLLEASVAKLDVLRKTPLKKTIIELDNQQRQGKNVITQDHHAFVSGPAGVDQSPAQGFKQTRGSIVSTSRTSLFSPGSTLRGQSPGFDQSQQEWSKKSIDVFNQQINANPFRNGQPSDSRGMRRMISLDNQDNRGIVGQSMQARQFQDAKNQGDLVLPDITNPMVSTNYNQRFGAAQQSPLGHAALGGAPKMSLTSTGGAGFNSGATGYTPSTRPQMRTIQNEPMGLGIGGNSGMGGGPIRPPLYVPTKRESSRTGNASSLVSGGSNQQQPATDQGFKQFKTEFNSQLYAGGNPSSSTTIQNQPSLTQSNTYQKKPTLGANSIFKPQQPSLQFEAGIKRYQEPSAQANNNGKGPLDI